MLSQVNRKTIEMILMWAIRHTLSLRITCWIWSFLASFISISFVYRGFMKPEHQFLLEHAKTLKRDLFLNEIEHHHSQNAGSASAAANPENTKIGSIYPLNYKSMNSKKMLVLDLDETLVSSSVKQQKCDYHVDVLVGGLLTRFYVKKRPYLRLFIETVSNWFDLVIFTASLSLYANPLIDQFDHKKRIKRRLYRQSCIHKGSGQYVKDLSVVHEDLSQVMIIDNAPISYSLNKENGIRIKDWYGDDYDDKALLELLPFLEILRCVSDVRAVLGVKR